MNPLLSEFENHPKERDLIGQMLMAYGELEFGLLGCIHESLGVDTASATRILFRVRGESARLEVSDAILRPICAKHNLKDDWITTHSAVKYCKNIRNQYAHCHWQNAPGLSFIDLDDDAISKDDDMFIKFRPIDLPLLQRQAEYFVYASSLLYFMADNLSFAIARKRLIARPFPRPKSIPQPPRDNRPSKDVPIPAEGAK